jgi:hypothetical protein
MHVTAVYYTHTHIYIYIYIYIYIVLYYILYIYIYIYIYIFIYIYIYIYISPPNSSWSPGVFYTAYISITTPIVSALKNYYI